MSDLSPTTYPTIEGKPAGIGSSPFGQVSRPPSPGSDGPPRFRPQVMRSIRMRPVLALSVAGAVFCLLVILGFRQARVYSSESLIYVEPTIPGSYNEVGASGYDQFRYASYVDQQMQTVVRPDILTSALATLPPDTWRKPDESLQSAVMRLQKALLVERELTSYQISIKLLTPDPQTSADVVNAVTQAYLKGGRQDEISQASGRERLLGEERQRIAEELDRDRKEESSLGANLGVANPVTAGDNPFDLQLGNLRVQLATARQAHDVAEAQLSTVSGDEQSSKSGLAAAADDAINTDQGLSSMKGSVNQRRVILETQMAGLTPLNPDYKKDQQEIADLNLQLDTLTKQERGRAETRIQDRLRTELQRTAAVENQLNAELAQATAQATGAGPKLQRASELSSDIQRLTGQYATVDGTLRGLELQTNGPSMEHLTLAASAPSSPEPNKRMLLLLAALPAGLLLGVLAAIIARAVDRRVYLGADLEQAIGFAPIAVIPAREDFPARVVDEYILRLAAGIESAYRTTAARSFVVTSISPTPRQEALLQLLARQLEGMRLRVQVLHAAELLTTSDHTAEHRIATSPDTAPGHSLTLWGNPGGEGIAAAKLHRMKGEFHITLIDAAPLLHSAATEYAARCADATILIAGSGETTSTEVTAAAALLARLRVTGVAAVLDGLRLQFADEAFQRAVRAVEHLSSESAPPASATTRTPDQTPMSVATATAEPDITDLSLDRDLDPVAEAIEVIPDEPVLETSHRAAQSPEHVPSVIEGKAEHLPLPEAEASADLQIPEASKSLVTPPAQPVPASTIVSRIPETPSEWQVPIAQPLPSRPKVAAPRENAQPEALAAPEKALQPTATLVDSLKASPAPPLTPSVPEPVARQPIFAPVATPVLHARGAVNSVPDTMPSAKIVKHLAPSRDFDLPLAESDLIAPLAAAPAPLLQDIQPLATREPALSPFLLVPSDPSPSRPNKRSEPILPLRSEQASRSYRSSATRATSHRPAFTQPLSAPVDNRLVHSGKPPARASEPAVAAPIHRGNLDSETAAPQNPPGLSRRWALLSQFGPASTQPETETPPFTEQKARLRRDAQG